MIRRQIILSFLHKITGNYRRRQSTSETVHADPDQMLYVIISFKFQGFEFLESDPKKFLFPYHLQTGFS